MIALVVRSSDSRRTGSSFAQRGRTNRIIFERLNSSTNTGLYTPWTWGSDQESYTAARVDTIWAVALGHTENGPAHMDIELRGLDMSVTYDL